MCFGLLAAAIAVPAGCVAEGDAGPTAAIASTAAAGAPAPIPPANPPPTVDMQPVQATYRCAGNTTLTIQNMRSSVVLTDPQGDSVTLPASPAAQQSRYGQTGYALVLEGNDALYMKGGKPPLTCKR